MKRIFLLPTLLILLLSNGCRTYFGYEATTTEEDIKNSSQLISSKFKGYQIELDGSQIRVWEKYEDTYQKDVAEIEHREHVYVGNDPAFCLVALPFRVIGDILVLAPISRDWHLATNPPNFFTRLTYIPPFSYFAFFRNSPYWIVDPKTLKEGENIEQLSDGNERVITKTIEKEHVELTRKKVTFQVPRKKAVTDGNIVVQLEEKSSRLDLKSPFITLGMLNREPYPARLINVIVCYKEHNVQLQLDSRELLSPNEQLQQGRKYFADKNFDEALKWIQKAAEQGNATAQRLLGVCYFEGKGIEKNLTQAQYWLELAAAQNDTDAISRLKKLKKELEEELQ